MPRLPYIQHSDGSIHEGQSVQPRDLPDIAVEERELTFIRVDHQVRFQFGVTEVMIESPFTLLARGQEYESDPEHREGLGPVLVSTQTHDAPLSWTRTERFGSMGKAALR